MSLASQVNLLAKSVGNRFRDAVYPRLLPAGGTAGQPLLKNTEADFATAWGPRNNSAGAAAPSITDDASKGYAAGSRWLWPTAGAEYVCTDGTTGSAKWVITNPRPRYLSNRNYTLPGWLVRDDITTVTSPLMLLPIYIPRRITIDRLGMFVTNPDAAGAFLLGIYGADPTTLGPTTRRAMSASPGDTSAYGLSETTLDAPVVLEGLCYVAQVIKALKADGSFNSALGLRRTEWFRGPTPELIGNASGVACNATAFGTFNYTYPSMPANLTGQLGTDQFTPSYVQMHVSVGG